QADLCAALGQHREIANHFDRIPDFARVTHINRETLQAFVRFADIVATDRGGNHTLHVRHVQTIAPGGSTVDLHDDVASSGQAFSKGRGHAGNLFHHALDFRCDAIDL